MSRRPTVWLAITITALTVAVVTCASTFTPWGTDAAAYIEEAHRWATGQLVSPLPQQFIPSLAMPDWCAAPLGFRPGVERGTEVGQYPLGFPLLIAAALRVGGDLAGYLVVPLTTGLLVWCAYRVGTILVSPWAGVIAALLIAISPVTLASAVQPMSDVPAAALWALSWLLCLGPKVHAASAGAAAALAIMVRPNLGPFVFILIGLLMTSPGRWFRLGTFLSMAAIGPILVWWSQSTLYGAMFVAGAGSIQGLYSLDHVAANLGTYPWLLAAVHSPLIFLGLLGALLVAVPASRGHLERGQRQAAVSAVAFAVTNYLLYLPYVPLPDPAIVRYMMPALMALCVLLAGTLVLLARMVVPRSRLLALLVVMLPLVLVIARSSQFVSYALGFRHDQEQLRLAGPYLQQALPENAAILTLRQSAGLAHYTKRLIARLDCIDGHALDRVVSSLRLYGYHPVVVLESDAEAAWFRANFAASTLHALDWPPRAQALNRLQWWDPADREDYARGIRWSTDVLR